jgi:hypothetical protein
MSEDRSVVRAIAWREVFPWLRLLGVFRMAIRPRILLIAIVAALFCTTGWRVIGLTFEGSDDPNLAYVNTAGERVHGPIARLYTHWPWEPLAPSDASRQAATQETLDMNVGKEIADAGYYSAFGSLISFVSNTFLNARPILQLIGFGEIFNAKASLSLTSFLLLCLVWAIVVWAFAGAMITRIAAVAFARGEQISWNRANLFAWRKWPSFFASPMLPLVGVVLIALVLALIGLIMRIAYIGIPFIALTWPLFLIGGLLMAILLLGLIVGWPLMWCTISCEGTDSFDALGRSYGYVFGKPLQFLGYAIVAALLGWLGWYVVDIFANLIVSTTQWAVSWGSTGVLMQDVTTRLPFAAETPENYTGLDVWSAQLMYFFNGCVRSIPIAFLYSYFWCAAMMIYLLLRRDEDQTEIDEVYLEEEQETYGMPPLRTDSAGVSEPADVPAPAPKPAAPAPSAVPPPTDTGGPLPLE